LLVVEDSVNVELLFKLVESEDAVFVTRLVDEETSVEAETFCSEDTEKKFEKSFS
jgi:hypothetical protein